MTIWLSEFLKSLSTACKSNLANNNYKECLSMGHTNKKISSAETLFLQCR